MEGFGVLGRKIFKLEDLKDVVVEMIVYDGFYLLYVEVEKEENVFFMVVSGKVVDEIVLEF